jgi:DNA helicase-2/ATP-dependent DNA helicase PcrA
MFGYKKRAAPRRKQMDWSSHQRRVFTDVAIGEWHTIVLAAPGSGKSTTIIESLYHIPEPIRSQGKVLVTAFNSSIVKELETKVPIRVEAKTFHQVGFSALRKNWGATYSLGRQCVDAKGEIAEQLACEEVGFGDEYKSLRKSLVRAMSLAKAELAENINDIETMVVDHGLSTTISPGSFSQVVYNMMEKTRDEPRVLNGRSCISFDDMLWLPHVHGWQLEQYDRIFIDEAQDLSEVRTGLILNSLKYDGRLVSVGDKHQALYSWAGATPAIIDQLKKKLNAKLLPLSVSYRLPKNIVNLAKSINPDIEAADDAIDGEITNITTEQMFNKIPSGTSILSRSNWPLVTLAFQLLANGYKANIQGRDIGERFLWRISVWNPDSVEQLQRQIIGWQNFVTGLLQERKRSASHIADEAKSILRFCDGADTVADVRSRIKEFFSDDPANIKLSTVHKAKGLEWDNVFLLNDTFKPDKNEEEKCVYYVSITRSKKKLVFVHGKD